MISIKNIDSQIPVSILDQAHINNRISRTWGLEWLAERLPVYLVNPDTMDEIYPPQKRQGLHPECVSSLFKEMERIEKENVNMFWENIERCSERIDSCFTVAMGLYSPHIPPNLEVILEQDYEGPQIFICPERIADLAGRLQEGFWAFQLLFSKVYLHELGHHITRDISLRFPTATRFLVESLCNGIAYDSMFDEQERNFLKKVFSSQPLEYRGWPCISRLRSVHYMSFRVVLCCMCNYDIFRLFRNERYLPAFILANLIKATSNVGKDFEQNWLYLTAKCMYRLL